MKKLFLFLFASLLSISMFAQSGATKAQAIPYNWGTGIYVSSEAHVGKWYVVNLLKTQEPAGPFDATGKDKDGKTDINITIKNPLSQEVDINCTAYIGDNETNRHFKMAADGTKSMTFGAGMFVRMGINEVYLYLVTDVTVTEEEAKDKEAVNVDVQTVEANSVVFTPVDYNWTTGNTIAANTETWLKIDMSGKVGNTQTFKITVTNNGSAATTIYGGFATDCPATNIQEQTKDIAANAQIEKVLDRAMLDMIPDVIYIRLKAGQQIHVWAEAVDMPANAPVLFKASDATEVAKNVAYSTATSDPLRPDSIVYKADYATLIPSASLGDDAKYYAVQVTITNNGSADAEIVGKIVKNPATDEVKSAVTRTYTVKAGQTISKKLDKTLLSNMEAGDEAYALVLGGKSNITFILQDVCLEDNPCVPAQAIDMVIPAVGNFVEKNQAAGTKWYAVDITAAKSAATDIKLTMTAAQEVDLTVDIAAACAIGEPTQSYTGSSASTEKVLSYSLIKDAGDVVYVRVKTNKALTVKAELINKDLPITWNGSEWSNGIGPKKEKSAWIEGNLTIASGKIIEASKLYISTGVIITVKSGGALFVGDGGVSGGQKIVVEDHGMFLISPEAPATYSKPYVEAHKTLHLGTQPAYYTYVDDDHRATLPDLHEFITVPVIQPEDLNARCLEWNRVSGWKNKKKISEYGYEVACEPFIGYNIYTKDGETNYGDYNAVFSGQLASNRNQSFQTGQIGWYAFGNAWFAPIKLSYLLDALKTAYSNNPGTTGEANQLAVYTYIASPMVIPGLPSNVITKDNYYLPLTAEIAAQVGVSEIKPMQGFFLFTEVGKNIEVNYTNVWNDATGYGTTPSQAPKRVAVADDRNKAAVVLRGGNNSDFVYLIEGKATNASKMVSADLAIYAENNLVQVASENLIGTILTIKTNNATEYTLSFGWLNGETMYLRDLQNGMLIEMTKDNTYTFTAEPNTVSARFQVVGRNNVVTGIENSAVIEGVNKRIENGNVVIIKNGVKYNVLGTQL